MPADRLEPFEEELGDQIRTYVARAPVRQDVGRVAAKARARSTGRMPAALLSLGSALAVVAILAVGLMLRPGGPVAGPSASPLPTAVTTPVTSASDSAAPSPDQSPLVNGSITDRTGVPDELRSRPWVAEVCCPWPSMDGGTAYEVGVLGTTALILLPEHEVFLAASDSYLAAAAPGAPGSTIVVRRIPDGSEVRRISTGIEIDPNRGAIAGGRLYWTGTTELGTIDGGVFELNLEDPSSTPQVVVAGGVRLASFDPPAGRGPFHLSSTARTLSSTLGSGTSSSTDIIDVATATLRLAVRDQLVFAVGDDVLVARRETDLAILDFSGHQLASVSLGPSSPSTVYGVMLTADQVFVEFSSDGRYELIVERIADGTSRVLHQWTTDPLFFAADLSSSTHLVLLPAPALGDALALSDPVDAAILDVATGAIEPAAFRIGSK